MEALVSVDWAKFFIPEHSVLEMVLRGTFMYLAIFIFMRLMGRRQAGSYGPADLLVIVLLADAAQNGMAHEYTSVTEGIALVATILVWDLIIDKLAFHVPKLRPYLRPSPLPLVQNGRIMRKNLREELITYDELLSQLREQGVEDPKQVKVAQLEEDGRVSVIKREK